MKILLITGNRPDDKLFSLVEKLTNEGHLVTFELSMYIAWDRRSALDYDAIISSLRPALRMGQIARPLETLKYLEGFKKANPKLKCAICTNDWEGSMVQIMQNLSIDLLPINAQAVLDYLYVT